MRKVRKHERAMLTADLILQRDEEGPARFAARVLNASEGGMAIFSKHSLQAGDLVNLEMILPLTGEGIRRVCLHGVARWMRVMPEGNTIGIELVRDQQAGDYEWFVRYIHSKVLHDAPSKPHGAVPRRGFSLVELSIALIILCLMMTLAAPIFTKAIEQARLDTAAANLKAIWAAQRAYWLEERSFAPMLTNLYAMDLVDAPIANSTSDPNAVYMFDILSASDTEFVCRAQRNGSQVWSGNIQIDEEGTLSGSIISDGGAVLTPAQ